MTVYWGLGGGGSHMKQAGMLVVSLRGVKFWFWSRLGCSGQSTNILCRSRLGFREETQNYAKRNRSQIFFLDKSIRWLCLYIIKTHCMSHFCVFKQSLLGSKFAWATPSWSPLGVKFKISDEHPRLFHMGVPPPGHKASVCKFLRLEELCLKLHFRDGLVWTVGLTVETKLLFPISPALCGMSVDDSWSDRAWNKQLKFLWSFISSKLCLAVVSVKVEPASFQLLC